MAFNPFHSFRKHQKVIFAVMTIICMFVFVLQFGRGLTKIFTTSFQRSRDREMARMRHARLRDRPGRRKIAPLPETAGGNPMQSKAQIDQILREKSEAKEIPGVVKSLAWAGLANTYFWIDPARNVAGVILMQLLPFADGLCLEAFAGFERGIYAGLDAAGQKAA